MNMNKSSMRHLALGFFISGVLLSGYALLSDESSLSAEEQEYKERYEELLAENNSTAPVELTEDSTVVEESEYLSSADTTVTDTSTTDSSETDPEAAEDSSENPSDEPVTTVVVVKQGDPVSFASDQLKSQGIIDSATEFNDFLEENEYTTEVRPGSYEVNSDMTFEEIARTLMDQN